tara:strand:+ start:70417 stop:71271 length:855 start_codon:yes stop_codon:yes gene_type:complete
LKIGAHVSTAGGVDKAIDRASLIEAEAVQIFVSSPRGWTFKPLDSATIDLFREKSFKSSINPVVFHGIYLVSLGTDNQENLEKGVQSLINYMTVSEQLDALGVVFHAGSHKGRGFDAVFDQAVNTLERILSQSPNNRYLILENSAGMGDHLCSSFYEIGRILRALESPNLKICLDTQHVFAAGYAINEKSGLEQMLDEFDKHIGLDNLVAVHANDSKTPLGSSVDRHENIGQGYIGVEGFQVIMANPIFKDVPFFLEVPGMNGDGPDKENVAILKDIRDRLFSE